MNINRIEFMVTYQCSGKCKHCSVGEKLNYNKGGTHVIYEKVADTIETLAKLFKITSVMTFGGEPLFYSDVVCNIHKKAAACNINSRQLITNGYFTKNKEKCKSVARDLSTAGVNNLLLSVDAFHQETIPIDSVYYFANKVVKAGLKEIYLSPSWVINEENANIYNTKTREILSYFSDLKIPISEGNNIFMAGNALEHLTKYYPKPDLNLLDKCGVMPYTEPLTAISSLSIVPSGDVMICGFVIGNIYNEDISAIIAHYNPHKNIYMYALIKGIILFKKAGFVVDICHRVLNKIYPN